MTLHRIKVPRSALRRPTTATAVFALCLAVLAAAIPALADQTPKTRQTHRHPLVLGAVAPVRVTQPEKPLPRMQGSIPLRRDLTVKPSRTAPPAQRSPADRPVGGLAPMALATPSTSTVALRALIVGIDADDWGVATWRATLDRVGTAYDVLYSKTTALTATTLVRPDAAGRYNAILLTSSTQLYPDGGGGYVSGLDANEWNTLWAYERDYGVRQATLYTSYGTWPEDYCLSGSSEGGVGDTPLPAALTTTGADVLNYLAPGASIPLVQSYVYRTRVTTGCSGQAVLHNGDDVLGVLSTSTDGRERLALSFTSNQYLLQSNLLTYGLFRWASHGLFLGEQRHYLNADIDDWFNSADHYFPDGHIESDPGYRMSGHDAYNLYLKQAALRTEHPFIGNATVNLAYNGGDADLSAGTTCSPSGGISTLTATSRCLAGNFRWLNHTLTHPELNFTDYATSYNEIAANRTVATTLGLSQPNSILKTGEYSGLGVYNPDPNDDVNPPTDHGLTGSNQAFLDAASDLGVQYVHGNMSFPSHVPACFDCGIVHPLKPAITVVPDWPTNIAYHTTKPDEQIAFYNSMYGPGGRFPYWPTNLTYAQMLDYEAQVAFGHVATGSIYSHTFHIANVRDYGSGNTLITDWLDAVYDKYGQYYSVPLLNPAWPDLAAYASSRNSHFAELSGGVDAVYNPSSGSITVTSPLAGSVTVTGGSATGYTTYGSEVASSVTLTGSGSVTIPASPLP
jgi:hypothetical protein